MIPGVGRDVWKSSSPITFLKQGYVEQVASDHIYSSVEYLQGWKLQNLYGQPVPVFDHSHCKKDFFFLFFDIISYISVCAYCLIIKQIVKLMQKTVKVLF